MTLSLVDAVRYIRQCLRILRLDNSDEAIAWLINEQGIPEAFVHAVSESLKEKIT